MRGSPAVPLVVSLPAGPPVRVRVVAADPLVRAALPAVLREAGAQTEDDGGDGAADLDLVADDPAAAEPGALALVADADAARVALAAGARGVLPRDAEGPTLLATLAALAQGLVVLDPALAVDLVPGPAPASGLGDVELLTDREGEVLALVAEGLPNKLVADRLGITERTARYHVAQILAKLGAQSRTEAVVTGARLGLVVL